MKSIKSLTIPAISAVGAAYCLVSLSGEKLLCATAGCEVYASFRLLGYPLYLWGAVLFLLLAVVSGPRATPEKSRWPLYPLVFGALVLDALLLGYQSVFWPCLSCLFIAVLLGTIAALCLWLYPTFRTRAFGVVMAAWLLLFVNVGVASAKELLSPWAIAGASDAPILVYFSPTCGACEELIRQLLASPDAEQAAFYPIAKNEEDLKRIQVVLGQGWHEQEAVRRLFEEVTGEGEGSARLRLDLLFNKISLATRGITRVPAVIASSLPRPPVSPLGVPSLSWSSDPDRESGCGLVETISGCQ